MKHPAKHMLGTLLGLILALSAVPGHAQDGAKIKATIPFNFVVGNKELKAGNYVTAELCYFVVKTATIDKSCLP